MPAQIYIYMQKKTNKKNILLENIITVMKQAKGKEIISLDLEKIETAICKHFILCTGTSSTHVNSIENKIKKIISQKLGEKPWGTEGNNVGEWVLMDYYDIIVHIFQEKTRKLYNIEDLWADANLTKYQE